MATHHVTVTSSRNPFWTGEHSTQEQHLGARFFRATADLDNGLDGGTRICTLGLGNANMGSHNRLTNHSHHQICLLSHVEPAINVAMLATMRRSAPLLSAFATTVCSYLSTQWKLLV